MQLLICPFFFFFHWLRCPFFSGQLSVLFVHCFEILILFGGENSSFTTSFFSFFLLCTRNHKRKYNRLVTSKVRFFQKFFQIRNLHRKLAQCIFISNFFGIQNGSREFGWDGVQLYESCGPPCSASYFFSFFPNEGRFFRSAVHNMSAFGRCCAGMVLL